MRVTFSLVLREQALAAELLVASITNRVSNYNFSLCPLSDLEMALALLARAEPDLGVFEGQVVLLPFLILGPHFQRQVQVTVGFLIKEARALLVGAFRALEAADFVDHAVLQTRRTELMVAVGYADHLLSGNLGFAYVALYSVELLLQFLAAGDPGRDSQHRLPSDPHRRRWPFAIFACLCLVLSLLVDDVLENDLGHLVPDGIR